MGGKRRPGTSFTANPRTHRWLQRLSKRTCAPRIALLAATPVLHEQESRENAQVRIYFLPAARSTDNGKRPRPYRVPSLRAGTYAPGKRTDSERFTQELDIPTRPGDGLRRSFPPWLPLPDRQAQRAGRSGSRLRWRQQFRVCVAWRRPDDCASSWLVYRERSHRRDAPTTPRPCRA
jgi:hypothetical protein